MDSLRITSQLQSEWQDSGLSFRIMLVGESGQGKSTFTRALLRPYVPDHLLHKGNPEALCARTTEITEIVHRVDNEGYPVEFTIVDCPGYGDAIDCSPWIQMITRCVTRGGCDPVHWGLQPCALEAATVCTGGCDPVHWRLRATLCIWRLRPYASRLVAQKTCVTEALTTCDGGCNHM